MAIPRFQFRLSTLLWITLAVACWFGGMGLQAIRSREREEMLEIRLRSKIDRIEEADAEIRALVAEKYDIKKPWPVELFPEQPAAETPSSPATHK